MVSNKAKEYRDHAEELRVVSTMMCSPSCRDSMLQTADLWEKMAISVEKKGADAGRALKGNAGG